MAATLFKQNIIACIWDFDKTLIAGYMQWPLFRRYGIDEPTFWKETNALVDHYHRRGYRLSSEISYLNHLLTYVQAERMPGLNNKILRECGRELKFYPGLPDLLPAMQGWVREKPDYRKHDIQLEHYIVSTGLAEMIRGSAIREHVQGIWACEYIENPLRPGFLEQKELELGAEAEIAQIGMVIDNTTKTRALFEINKGSNKNPAIDVNSKMAPESRRIPFQNMIYVADGPSDIPSFSVVRGSGGLAYAVHDPLRPDEFAQNDRLREMGRIDHYGPADYTEGAMTPNWLRLHIRRICDRIVAECEAAVLKQTARPPVHLNPTPPPRPAPPPAPSRASQSSLFPEA